jgi:peptidoglycan/LPS O-acetylase OafA/YrhL
MWVNVLGVIVNSILQRLNGEPMLERMVGQIASWGAASERPSLPAPPRIPGLDGLRAVAILLVLCSHVQGAPGAPSLPLPKGLHLGELGVRIFFVISGYLITSLLLREVARRGQISLRDFFARRVLRIFPAFYVFLLVVFVLAAERIIELRPGDALHAVTYTMNYHGERAWWLGHLWSLSVEEQFYLFWPVILALVGARRGLMVAAAAVVAAPLIRVGTWVFWPSARAGIGEVFPTVFDALAVGCLLAGLSDRLGRSPRYLAALRSPFFALVPLFGLAISMVPRVSFELAVGQSLVNVAIAFSIDRCVRCPEGVTGRLLARPTLVWIGSMSYSLYLWQQLFLNRHSEAWLNAFPLNLGLTFAVAAFSYYGIEQPILRLRPRASEAPLPQAA